MSQEYSTTTEPAPPLRLLRKLRRLADTIGSLPLRWSTEGPPEKRFQYLDAGDLEEALRPALHALNLSVTTPVVEVRMVQAIGKGELIAEAKVQLRVTDLTSGQHETWTAMGLCDGSAATASGGAVTVARKAAWIGVLNCRSARDAEGHPEIPIRTAADELVDGERERGERAMKAITAAIEEGRQADVWAGSADAVHRKVRDDIAAWVRSEGLRTAKLHDLPEDRFAQVLAYARTGKW